MEVLSAGGLSQGNPDVSSGAGEIKPKSPTPPPAFFPLCHDASWCFKLREKEMVPGSPHARWDKLPLNPVHQRVGLEVITNLKIS